MIRFPKLFDLQDKHLEEVHGLKKTNLNIRNDENKDMQNGDIW